MEAGRVRHDSRVVFSALVVVVALLGVACSPANQASPSSTTSEVTAAPTPAPSSSVGLVPSPAVSVAPAPTIDPLPTQIPLERPFASTGNIAVVRSDGSLWVVTNDGRASRLADATQGTFGFPAWSPDGKLVAAVRTSGAGGGAAPTAAVVVFDGASSLGGASVAPKVIFQSSAIGPFYLSWTPDGTQVSFLANDAGSLSLRIAAADGSSALDGSGPGAVIRTGSPLYYDWIDANHLFAHIGAGPDAFLGELGRDGKAASKAIPAPGTFRSVVVSDDGKFIGYVRAGAGGKDAVVVSGRDGTDPRTMPVFDMGAVDFSPTSNVLASIGSIVPVAASVGFPIGPLRLIDAQSGKVRTLLDGDVLGFAWSPDGKTIAAIRFVNVPAGGVLPSAAPGASGASGPPAPSASAEAARTEIRLTFIDVASGDIRSDPNVRPSVTYVNGVLAYFDQYALSHHLWAPDSSSILLPELTNEGTEQINVFYPDGGAPVAFDGTLAFWSP